MIVEQPCQPLIQSSQTDYHYEPVRFDSFKI